MLILTRKVGESLMINDDIEIVVTELSGDKVKIGVIAPQNFRVLRKELYQTMEINKESASGQSAADIQDFLKNIKPLS